MKLDQSYELQARNQRQAMRRALQRLLDADLVHAMALGWCQVGGYNEFVRWQGGGSKQNYKGFPMETPRWRIVGLTHDGIKLALELEQQEQDKQASLPLDSSPSSEANQKRAD